MMIHNVTCVTNMGLMPVAVHVVVSAPVDLAIAYRVNICKSKGITSFAAAFGSLRFVVFSFLNDEHKNS